MSLKAGRVGVNPSQVDPVDGSILSDATSGYTKQEADAKFLTQTDAANTYESKSDASIARAALQPKTLAVPISMLDGTKLTVENALQGLNTEKFTYADNSVLGAKNMAGLLNGYGIAGNDQEGYILSSGAPRMSIIAKTKIGASYIISRANGVGDRFKVVGLSEYPSTTKHVNGATLYDDSTANKYTVNNIQYPYLAVFLNYQTNISSDIQGMIRLASDPDDTYVPYAMTNKEVTEFRIKLETDLLMASSFSDFQERMSS